MINIENKLETLTDAVSAYRSQFDDVNRIQMLAIIREDCRAVANEYYRKNLSLVYYRIDKDSVKGGRV